MKYIIPFNGDPEFLDWLLSIKKNHQLFSGVYFAGNPEIVSSGRKPKIQHFLKDEGNFLPSFNSLAYDQFIEHLIKNLLKCSITPILLLNYKVTDHTLKNKTRILDYIQELYDFGLRSFVIGDVNILNILNLNKRFDNIKLYTSVYLSIKNAEEAKYFEDIGFDVLTLEPGINRRLKLIEEIRHAVKSELSLLINEGCFPFCPWRIGHMELDSAQTIEGTIKELVYGRNTDDYRQMKCRPYFNEDPAKILNSTWILPQDIKHYETLIDQIKLDGRSFTTEKLIKTVKSYIEESYNGDLKHIIGTFTGMDLPLDSGKIPEDFFIRTTGELVDKEYLDIIIQNMKRDWNGINTNLFSRYLYIKNNEFKAFERSRRLYNKSINIIWKGGPEAKQHERLAAYDFPNYISRAKGVNIWDLDGNKYVDYLMSWGTIILGHGNEEVDNAVFEQIKKGVLFNLESEIEVHLAEKIKRLIPCAEIIRFLLTGSEAASVAIRVARAVTGRLKVIKYGYHGWHEWNQTDHPEGIHQLILNDVMNLEYNKIDKLENIFLENSDSIACVIMEPFKDEIPTENFLEKVKDITKKYGAILVFDEIKTGFRLSLGGAQEYFNVIPDIAIFSKAISNGYPLSFIAGKKEIFEQAEKLWVNGTYHGSLPSIAAADTTLSILEKNSVLSSIWERGRELMDGFNNLMEANGLNARLKGLPPLPKPKYFKDEKEIMTKFFSNMLKYGYYLHPTHVWFLSYQHSTEIVKETLLDMERALKSSL